MLLLEMIYLVVLYNISDFHIVGLIHLVFMFKNYFSIVADGFSFNIVFVN